MGKIVTLSIPQKLSTGELWGGAWNLFRLPHLQLQLCGQGLVLWVWWVVWRNSPAVELSGDALLLAP